MPEQRKQLYVKRSFQQNMILEVLLATFIIINLIVIVGYFMIDNMTDVQDLKLNLAFIVTAIEVIGFAGMYRYNLKSSHRIAGPIFNMERGLRSLESGDLSIVIMLRNDDNFHEVANQMNNTIGQLREHVAEAQRLAMRLQESQSNDPEVINLLVKELGFFQTEPNLSSEDEEGSSGMGAV